MIHKDQEKRKNVVVQKTVACIKAEFCLSSTITHLLDFRRVGKSYVKIYLEFIPKWAVSFTETK